MTEKFNLIPEENKENISNEIQITENTFQYGYENLKYPFNSKEAFQEAILKISNLASNGIEIILNENFHKNKLNIFEKVFGASKGKQSSHEFNVNILKGTISVATFSALNSIPYIIHSMKQRDNKNEFKLALISYSAWVTEKHNLSYFNKLKQMFKNIDFKFHKPDIIDTFKDYAGIEMHRLPNISFDGKEVNFLKFLTFLSDANDPEQVKRLIAIGKEGLGLSEKIILDIVNSTGQGQLVSSDFALFNSFLIDNYFNDLYENIPQALQYSEYNIENDPYRILRDERVEKIKSIGSKAKLSAISGILTFYKKGTIQDALLASSFTLLFDEMEIEKQFEFIKKMESVMGEFGKQ